MLILAVEGLVLIQDLGLVLIQDLEGSSHGSFRHGPKRNLRNSTD
jgi:hypothetical protein